MGCKLCSCIKSNDEQSLENVPSKQPKSTSKRFKLRLFGRKKDATVDVNTVSEKADDVVIVIHEAPVEVTDGEVIVTPEFVNPTDVQTNKAAPQEDIRTVTKATITTVLSENVEVVPVELPEVHLSSEGKEKAQISTTNEGPKGLDGPPASKETILLSRTTSPARNEELSATAIPERTKELSATISSERTDMVPATTIYFLSVSTMSESTAVMLAPTFHESTEAESSLISPKGLVLAKTNDKGIGMVPSLTSEMVQETNPSEVTKDISTPTDSEISNVMPATNTIEKPDMASAVANLQDSERLPSSVIRGKMDVMPAKPYPDNDKVMSAETTTGGNELVLPKKTAGRTGVVLHTVNETVMASSFTPAEKFDVGSVMTFAEMTDVVSEMISLERTEMLPASATFKSTGVISTMPFPERSLGTQMATASIITAGNETVTRAKTNGEMMQETTETERMDLMPLLITKENEKAQKIDENGVVSSLITTEKAESKQTSSTTQNIKELKASTMKEENEKIHASFSNEETESTLISSPDVGTKSMPTSTAAVIIKLIPTQTTAVRTDSMQAPTATVRTESMPTPTTPVRTALVPTTTSPLRTASVPTTTTSVRTKSMPTPTTPVRTASVPTTTTPVRTESMQTPTAPVRTASAPTPTTNKEIERDRMLKTVKAEAKESKAISNLTQSEERNAAICVTKNEGRTLSAADIYETVKQISTTEILSSKKKTQLMPLATKYGSAPKDEIKTVAKMSQKSTSGAKSSLTACNVELLGAVLGDDKGQSSAPIMIKENIKDSCNAGVKEAKPALGYTATGESSQMPFKQAEKDLALSKTSKTFTEGNVSALEESASKKLPIKLSSNESGTGSSSSLAEKTKTLSVLKAQEANRLSQTLLTDDGFISETNGSKSAADASMKRKTSPESASSRCGYEKALPHMRCHKNIYNNEEIKSSSNFLKSDTCNLLPIIKPVIETKTKQTEESREHKSNEMIQTTIPTTNDNSLPVLCNTRNKEISTPKVSKNADIEHIFQIDEKGPTTEIVTTNASKESSSYIPSEKRQISGTATEEKCGNNSVVSSIAEKSKALPVPASAVETKEKSVRNTSDLQKSLSVSTDRPLSEINNDQVLCQNKSVSGTTSLLSKIDSCSKEKSDDLPKNSSRKKKYISGAQSTPSKTSDEAREPFRKLAKALKAAKSLEIDGNHLKTNNEYSSTASLTLPQCSSMTTQTNTADKQKALVSNDASSIEIIKSQSLPTVSTLKKMKVSDFAVPKGNPVSPMKPLKIKPDAKHMFAIPAVAKADIQDESQIKWSQKESSSPKAQMPWMSRRPKFDVTFPPLGKSLLERFGSIGRILANRYVPQTRSIEVLKLEHNRVPGLKLRPSDLVKYPSVCNLAQSQNSLADRKAKSSDTERT